MHSSGDAAACAGAIRRRPPCRVMMAAGSHAAAVRGSTRRSSNSSGGGGSGSRGSGCNNLDPMATTILAQPARKNFALCCHTARARHRGGGTTGSPPASFPPSCCCPSSALPLPAHSALTRTATQYIEPMHRYVLCNGGGTQASRAPTAVPVPCSVPPEYHGTRVHVHVYVRVQTYIHMPYHTYIHTYRYHIPYRGTNTRQTEKHNCASSYCNTTEHVSVACSRLARLHVALQWLVVRRRVRRPAFANFLRVWSLLVGAPTAIYCRSLACHL